jgi:hypothetical protein
VRYVLFSLQLGLNWGLEREKGYEEGERMKADKWVDGKT